MKRFCLNSGFPFFWYRRIVRRTIVNQIRCCVPGSARLFLLKLEHLAPSCHLCRSHCLHYEHTMEHLTLQLDVMGTLAKQCNNVLPQLVAQLWILAVFLSDFIVTCVTTRSSRYLLRENTRRINSEKGQKGWGLSAKLGKYSAIWGKLGTALQAYTLNPCTKFPPNPTSRKVNT